MKFLLLRLVIASLAAAVVAPPALPQPIEQSLTFPIIALDHHGRPVKNLTPDSLLILDNKTPIVSGVKLLRAADFPLRLGKGVREPSPSLGAGSGVLSVVF
ncbi:MAG: hypothetical protein DMG90_15250 [Acidobacteria bacterium]|nr:MAG: hypothetical protein DMG90_15250 [Acidobacteriota bacterium]